MGPSRPSFAALLDALEPLQAKHDSCGFGVPAARGNTTVCGEFNFVADPEAAYIVLDRYTCPTYIATWEFSCRSSLPWVRTGNGVLSRGVARIPVAAVAFGRKKAKGAIKCTFGRWLGSALPKRGVVLVVPGVKLPI